MAGGQIAQNLEARKAINYRWTAPLNRIFVILVK